MIKSKKIISFLIKILIGVLSAWIIYKKLSAIPELEQQCLHLLSQSNTCLIVFVVLALMPLNWAIESFKWKLITAQIERVSYKTAVKSIFSGICVGNIAPGRTMEFLAKIIFFKPENRPSITVLHFINGMFQMLITACVGTIAIFYKLHGTTESSNLIYGIIIGGILVIVMLIWCILNVSFIQQKLKFIKWFKKMDHAKNIRFSKKLLVQLISLSIVRYIVFTTQFYLIYHTLSPQSNIWQIYISIAAYFMLTSIIPMISFIEPAIRAAIALYVFNNSSDNSVTVIVSSTFIWFVNVVVPSVVGYIIILKEKIDFKSAHAH